MNNDAATVVESLQWQDDHLRIIDQTYLPRRKVYSDIRDMGRMWEAIKKMRIRGGPAVGIAGGYGFYMGIKELPETTFQSFWVEVERVAEYLISAQPAVANLPWSLERIKTTMQANKDKPIAEIKAIALETARTIHNEDKRVCKKIGEEGAKLLSGKPNVLTHSNTGSLATGQYGTALSVVFHAHEMGREVTVWVSETRPLMQGARLTAWELKQADIPMKLIADSAAGLLMHRGQVDVVMVGADRVAANGDTINKIGTYPLAVVAKENDIPFYVALPLSTIDRELQQGIDLPLEERDGSELTSFNGSQVAPKKTQAYNPVFDVTPHSYITGFITEKGIIDPPFDEAFEQLLDE